MLRDRTTRRKLAILAMFLGAVFILLVVWSVLTGETEWWTLILILPAGAIMKRLSSIAASPATRGPDHEETSQREGAAPSRPGRNAPEK